MKKFDLKKEREKLGLTQEDVAAMTGWKARTVRNHELKGWPHESVEFYYKKKFDEYKNKC